jgi:hypothetical protein
MDRNNGFAKHYLNGYEVSSAAIRISDTLTNTEPVIIGGKAGSPYAYFSGRVSNLDIYNVALSASEINNKFNALRGRYGI